MRKISLPMVVTMMCVMISLVLGLFWINQKRQSPTKKSDETKITRTDYSQVAKNTLDWIDKQRNDEGWYILERGCDFEAKTCDTVWDNVEGNKDGLVATWARFNYYQQTKNPADLEIVKSDINKFYEKYPNGVDNALWICKITYDMYSSKLFDDEINKKLEEICFNTEIPKEIVSSDEYEKKLLETRDIKKVTPVWSSWLGYSLGLRGVDSYFGVVSDLVSQYKWNGNEEKLSEAKKYFESSKEIIEKREDLVKTTDVCLLGLSAIDLYEYGGKDENVLNYAKERFLSFSNEVNGIKKYTTTICGLMVKKLYKLTNDWAFLVELERNNKVMNGNLLDGGESFSKLIDDNGFFISSYGGFSFPFKDVAENGLAVELTRN